jgi:hypothetical protein
MKLRKVLDYISGWWIDGTPYVIIYLECGHTKHLPSGLYDENTKRMCKECK